MTYTLDDLIASAAEQHAREEAARQEAEEKERQRLGEEKASRFAARFDALIGSFLSAALEACDLRAGFLGDPNVDFFDRHNHPYLSFAFEGKRILLYPDATEGDTGFTIGLTTEESEPGSIQYYFTTLDPTDRETFEQRLLMLLHAKREFVRTYVVPS